MRRYIIPILLISSLIGVIMYVIFNTTLVFSFLIPHYVQTHYKTFKMQSFRMTGQSFQLPDKLTLQGVDFVIERNKKTYHFEISQMTVYDIAKYETNRRHFRALLEGLNVEGGGIRARNFDVRLLLAARQSLLTHLDGIFQGETFEFRGYQLQDIEAHCKGDFNKFQIYEISTRGYGGQGRGQLSLEKKPGESVVLWLELYGMNPKDLVALNEKLFSQIEGPIDGTFRVIKGSEQIDLFSVSFILANGGALKPSLMQDVIPAIVDSGKENLVQTTMKRLGVFPVAKASLYLQNSDHNTLMAMFGLENKEFNLQVKGNKEIKVPEGLTKLFLRP